MTTLAETKTSSRPPRVRQIGPRARAQRKEAIALVAPALLPIIIFSVIPLVSGVLLGFTDATLARNAEISFIGLDNFIELAGDRRFWQSFGIGIVWAGSVALLTLVSAMGLALLLNSNLRLKGLTRVLALIPWAMPPVVIAIVWRMIYNPNSGPLNGVLGWLGIPGVNWLGDFSTALPAVIVVGVWAGIPQTTVLLLAGMQSIAPEQHEAAAVDGAGAVRRFWHVTLPALRPVIIAVTALDFIWQFNSFGLIYVLTEGGPGGRTMIPPLFTYLEAFRNREIGYASAMGNVLVVAILVILSLYLINQFRQNKGARK
ncbi:MULTISPECIES: carbohydrate ABC transporter permease [Microbacterium]|jgi:multiple sugar transport system permease protein|uniref:Multiple sugar transport system permease protein n=2 Tax=Microbacterium TaxID=33882 RepID=A0ABU1I2I6_9MICO|nr:MULTISPECIES: sugar ABC transporter permease [Microbacterium]APF34686.1 transporter [Microbacterium paludicola]MDR6167910.1 multiple sugar transport system permease protein [Microbacterium paludicola]OAZ44620.1 transporter [Microbacterium arborescens]POX68373.1 sugar ABC transporter permease [Microbacterium sp. Ru50]QCR41752.1 sugar ABC transporter permease [Microbacterium sp. SGAir0570]